MENKSPGAYNTTKSWSISGVPLIIQTKVLLSHFNGLNFDIEQNVITNPSGNARSNVIKNSSMLIMNPELKDSIGLVAIIIFSFFLYKNI
ncbi:hypothetical protein EUBHAL_00836 [Anaerobutyricum hallii DSM 3353]|jgi:hypothetical protein|uniref:Uncharacterized protein n=1 Tax=Anaerobutyricum hallii DSM 3353 TaxID=411469 RepID=C0ETV3_9FIRM|nr:hypothetical protein EUBHAL_00836 [Anaerobutyricum hallii DSM 3353]